MNKTFGELNKGDKIYKIKIENSRLVHKPDKSCIEPIIIKTVSTYNNFHSSTTSLVMENSSAIYPDSNKSAYEYRTCVDTSPYKKLNAYIYATTKKECLDTAIAAIDRTCEEQRKYMDDFVNRMKKIMEDSLKAKEKMAEYLETADYPDTLEEFACMALT